MKFFPLRRLRNQLPATGAADGGGGPGNPGSSALGVAMRLGRLSAWSLDLPDLALHWSNEALSIYGYDPQSDGALTVRTLVDSVQPSHRDAVEQALDDCIRVGTPFDVEAPVDTAGRRATWIRLIGEARRDAAGGVVGIVGAVQDITEPRELAQRAHETGERLTATLENMTDAFFTVDRGWHFTYVNRQAERLLRRPRARLLGRLIWAEFPEALESTFHREYERALAHFHSVEFEASYPPLGLWLRVQAFPSLHGLAVYFRDVTEERRVRQALSDSEEQHRRLFEISIDAILRGRPDGRIDSANPAACALFRTTEEGLRRLGRAGLAAPEDGRMQELTRRRQQTGACKGDVTLVRADGSRFEAEITAVEFRAGDDETCMYIIVRDITERIRSRRQIEALNAQLVERVRVRTAQLESANGELKGFAHSLAHDLRGLIANVDRYSEVLARSLGQGGSPRDAHYLARIRSAARQMDDFTQALLSLAQVSQAPLAWQPVDLGAVAERLLAELQETDRVRAVRSRVQQRLVVLGDPRLLGMALQNLLGNAWKFTSRRTLAEISFGASTTPDGETVYYVRDNGAGFDPTYAHRLFGTFQRLHSAAEFPGTGIGLANVQRIISRHGGRIWAESAEGEGATFFFTLGAPLPGADPSP